MLIRLGFDIQFEIPAPVPIIALIYVHPTRRADLREPDEPRLTPSVPITKYEDSFGNMCSRFVAPAGKLQLYNSTLIEDSGEPDPVSPQACQMPVEDLPPEVLRFLLASRYCEVDRLLDVAGNLFGNSLPGSAIGCRRMSRSATPSPVRPRRRWMSMRIVRASAAIFSIWQSRFAAA